MISREIWGPALWRVLHTFARKAGNVPSVLLEKDELHNWINFIKNLENLMPCDLCSSHYHKWVIKHNLNELANYRGFRRQEWLENFWWKLHNEVNERGNKPAFAKEDLKQYDDVGEFASAYELIKRMILTSIQQGQLQLTPAKTAQRYMEMLRRLYNL